MQKAASMVGRLCLVVEHDWSRPRFQRAHHQIAMISDVFITRLIAADGVIRKRLVQTNATKIAFRRYPASRGGRCS